jgi:hypothetical protein
MAATVALSLPRRAYRLLYYLAGSPLEIVSVRLGARPPTQLHSV